MIQVWHIKEHAVRHELGQRVMVSTDEEQKARANDLWNAGGYVKVADITTDSLETAWRLTNNVDSSWSMQPDALVTVTAPLHVVKGETYGRRSSMTGDVFVVIKDKVAEYYVVAYVGFQLIMTAPVETKWLWMPEAI